MLKISKKVEYGILAVQYISVYGDDVVSVKEISTKLNLSNEFLSKIMQTLKKKSIIQSVQGINGGYKLTPRDTELNVMDIILAFDEKIALVDCIHKDFVYCSKEENCPIKNPMQILQDKIENIFLTTTISELNNPSMNKNSKISNIDYIKTKEKINVAGK